MSENCVFSSFQKPNRITKNAALCVEERHALTVSRQTGGDLVFLVVVRINYGISLLCVPAEINDGHVPPGQNLIFLYLWDQLLELASLESSNNKNGSYIILFSMKLSFFHLKYSPEINSLFYNLIFCFAYWDASCCSKQHFWQPSWNLLNVQSRIQ